MLNNKGDFKMGKVIIAIIATLIVSLLGINTMGDMFLYLGMPSIIIGTIVGVGALLYSKIDNYENQIIIENIDFGELIKLRDIELLSDTELEEIIEIYQKKGVIKENYEQYQEYAKVLNELKEIGYFTCKQHADRIYNLKNYLNIE